MLPTPKELKNMIEIGTFLEKQQILTTKELLENSTELKQLKMKIQYFQKVHKNTQNLLKIYDQKFQIRPNI